jgi:hypothetical protein
MKLLLLAVLLSAQVVYAHGGSGHYSNEQMNATDSMIPLPIRINLDGSVSWGFMFGGMNHGGGMNHDGGMNHGGGMNHDGGMQAQHENMNGWMYHLMPMLTLSGDYYTRLINLNSKDGELTIESGDKGFIAIENKSISYGGGLGIMAMPMGFAIPMFGLRASLMPYKGGHVFRLKHIESRQDFGKVKSMLVPNDSGDLSSWAINDRMSFSSRGGVMFGAGVGMSILVQTMSTYMAEGQFVTSVSKVSESEVLVSIRKSRINMFSQMIGNMLVDLRAGGMASVDEDFNFIFDLSNTKAQKLYQEFLLGNILVVQQALLDGEAGIEHVKSSHGSTRGNMRRLSFGIPFLFNGSLKQGQMQTVSTVDNGMTGHKAEAYMAMYSRTRESDGVLSDHKNAGFMFMGMINTPVGQFRPNYAGTFKWYFQKEETSNFFFHRELKRLVNTLGLDNAATLAVPTLKNMGFVQAEVDLFLTKKDIDVLLEQTQKENLYQSMYNRTYEQMNKFFRNNANAALFCDGLNKILACKKRAYNKTWSAISKLPSILKQIHAAKEAKDLKGMSVGLGNLGKVALTNRFVLDEIFKTAGKNKIEAVLKVKGSRLSQTRIQL